MSSQRKQCCPTCKSPLIEHKQTLSRGLVKSLCAAWQQRGLNVFKVSELGLTHSEQANWQKLRYWHLAEKVAGYPGMWSVTETGLSFLFSEYRVPHVVWTYRGEVVDIDRSKLVGPQHCWDGYRDRRLWMRESRDRDPIQQDNLPGLTASK